MHSSHITRPRAGSLSKCSWCTDPIADERRGSEWVQYCCGQELLEPLGTMASEHLVGWSMFHR